MKTFYVYSMVLAGLTIGLFPQTSFALDLALGENGINIRALQEMGLTGDRIKIGQVEISRPPKNGLDTIFVINLENLDNVAIQRDSTINIKDKELGIHAIQVAGVMIGNNFGDDFGGVVPSARLSSSTFLPFDNIQNILSQDKAADSAQWVLDQGASVVNFSFLANTLAQRYYIPGGAPKLDGKNLLAAFVDWATVKNKSNDPLFIQAGPETAKNVRNGGTPQDAYNNIVVGFTKINQGQYNQVDVESLDNIIFHENSQERRKIDLVAPGRDINFLFLSSTGDLEPRKASGSSFAAPMVAGLAAQLQQNAGNGKKIPI